MQTGYPSAFILRDQILKDQFNALRIQNMENVLWRGSHDELGERTL